MLRVSGFTVYRLGLADAMLHPSLFTAHARQRRRRATQLSCFGALESNLEVLGGSGDLVSKVISPLIGVIRNYKYSYLIYNPSY